MIKTPNLPSLPSQTYLFQRFCLALLFLSLSVTSSPAAASTASAPTSTAISAEELYKMVKDGADIIMIDARTADKFREGHIPGAISMPADQVNAESLAEHAENMNKKFVFYCADTTCPASRIAAAKAIGAGYIYVYEFPGGYADWKSHGYDYTKPQLTK